jgi:hypothetical protein
MTTQPDLTLAYARAHATSDKTAAFNRYHQATTDTERDAAEHDYREAEDKLNTLPGLIPPDRLKIIYARWAKEIR